MITTMALISTVSIFFILFKFGRRPFKVILGYDKYVDVFLTIAVIVFMGTATMTGQMVGVMTALFISLFLWIGRKIYGYEVREKGEWVEKEGVLNFKKKEAKPKADGCSPIKYWVLALIVGPKYANSVRAKEEQV